MTGKFCELINVAVEFFWQSRKDAAKRQQSKGVKDTGARSEVTGGKNMDGFVHLVEEMVARSRAKKLKVTASESIKTLPGFFRPTKDWDVVITQDGKLVAVLEFKSQVGPSFGNNFNNRAEEAIGNATDFWLAFREGSFGKIPKPFLGYFFLMEDCVASRQAIMNRKSLYPVASEFRLSNRQKLLELLCRKMVRERLYDVAAAVVSQKGARGPNSYRNLSDDVGADEFFAALQAKLDALS